MWVQNRVKQSDVGAKQSEMEQKLRRKKTKKRKKSLLKTIDFIEKKN